ncbi:hypothetical protein ACFWP3_09625 [Streptomyces sp. NPDC058525]|uniref:hypothetical protein n=1 Tax=Streptomyces sp. NPDC058525 TaxID=3346538 RepID=UPI00366899EB
MAKKYRCGTCKTTSGWLDSDEFKTHRKTHRDRFHGGDAPDDEESLQGTAPMFSNGVGAREAALILGILIVLSYMWEAKG